MGFERQRMAALKEIRAIRTDLHLLNSSSSLPSNTDNDLQGNLPGSEFLAALVDKSTEITYNHHPIQYGKFKGRFTQASEEQAGVCLQKAYPQTSPDFQR
jgi:hypothetical protein